MTTTAQHMNARGDMELQSRFVAMAEMLHIPNPAGWVSANMPLLVTQEVDQGQSVADVHAYADETRKAYIAATPPTPGLNPGAVTDVHIQTAIEAIAPEPPTE